MLASQAPGEPCPGRSPSVFLFNPFAEACIAHGQAYTPVRYQALLAEDLANLPQYLGHSNDVVLSATPPSLGFLDSLRHAGFPVPGFVELREGRIDPASPLLQRELGSLRPWAWGPDSLRLLEPLFARVAGQPRLAASYFNDKIARLYSKAWGAAFLKQFLLRRRGGPEVPAEGAGAGGCPGPPAAEGWLCTEQEVGVAVDTLSDALGAIAAIRSRGHHRVVAKAAFGLAGHNAIRLWEPELTPPQRRWLSHNLGEGRQLVVEPWLERELDFSIQLEMGPVGLKLRGYTGLLNDRKGQFLANWAEPEYHRDFPVRIAELLPALADGSGRLQRFYDALFSALEAELKRVRFVGPVSIDALVYRTPHGDCRLKPVVEINPRYTLGRLTLELMERACPGSCGWFRLVNRVRARAEGFADLSSYAASLSKRLPLRLEGEPVPLIRQGALCLNDPAQAQVCLASFEVSPALNPPGGRSGRAPRRLD